MRGPTSTTSLVEVHGDLDWICKHLLPGCRTVVESSNRSRYELVYRDERVSRERDHRAVFDAIAGPLGIMATAAVREVPAVTVRVSAGGHRLTPAVAPKAANVKAICDADRMWFLDGVTTGELARFLESAGGRPVVDRTSLQGHWSIRLSHRAHWAGKFVHTASAMPLDESGLEARLERVAIPVTVVSDARTRGS